MVQPVLNTAFGLPVRSASKKCLLLLDAYAEQVLRYGANLQLAVLAAEEDPCCCLANTLAGAVCLSIAKKSPHSAPQAYLKRAEAQVALGHCTPYEQSVLQCILALASGDPVLCLEKHVRLLKEWPQDLVSLKRAQTLAFYTGQQDLMLRLAQMVEKEHRCAPFYHGCLAFALLEAGRLTEAEAAAQTGLALRKDDPWAQHALCHVYHERCQFEEGIRFMLARQHDWDGCCPFMYIHNWWHTALCYLDMGRPSDIRTVLEILDQRIMKEGWQEQGSMEDCLNGLGLLLRLELRGYRDEVQVRLEPIAERLENESLWNGELLLDLFACWALHCRQRGACGEQLLSKMEALANMKKGPRGVALKAGWLRLARALASIGARKTGPAAEALLGVDWKALKVIGASDEQLDVFEELLCTLLLGEGWCEEALRILEKRVAERERVPFTHMLIARCREKRGDKRGADEARERAVEVEASFQM